MLIRLMHLRFGALAEQLLSNLVGSDREALLEEDATWGAYGFQMLQSHVRSSCSLGLEPGTGTTKATAGALRGSE